jgi:cyclopropane fatty-acyl-phospholipid synthase-like methyltransferase
MAQPEFHDLAELQLNIDPASQSINSSWGNLGHWQSNDDQPINHYPQACKQLAIEVAHMASLNSDHKLLDTGFGCGDQLLVWLKNFQVKHVQGLNISHSQTLHAQQTLANTELSSAYQYDINMADCCLESSWKKLDLNFNRIIALDCIYHFSHKAQYFSLCKKHLAADGALVVSDLLAVNNQRTLWQSFLLRSICYFSHIPYQNLKTQSQYQAQLNELGLTMTQYKDISDQVFLPFGKWLNQYIPQVKDSLALPKKTSWLKYQGTAKFLAWGHRRKVFRYCILRIEEIKAEN